MRTLKKLCSFLDISFLSPTVIFKSREHNEASDLGKVPVLSCLQLKVLILRWLNMILTSSVSWKSPCNMIYKPR